MKRNRYSSQDEQGVSLILAAIFIAVLGGFTALVIGLGTLAAAGSRMQNLANLVATGSLEQLKADGNLSANVEGRANQIAQENTIPGTAGLMGDLSDAPGGGSGGEISYGNWVLANDGSNLCGANPDDYPCFFDTNNPATADAVQVVIRNDFATNPIVAPFAGLLGGEEFFAERTATSYIAGQCSVFLMDVSLSMTYENHFLNEDEYITPSTRSLFAFPATNCAGVLTEAEQLYCDLDLNRGSAPTVPGFYYRDDYLPHTVTVNGSPENILVNSFMDDDAGGPNAILGPEPLRSAFLGAHAALKTLYEGSSGSLWRMIGFRDQLTGSYPLNGFADDPGVLVQLTNINNRGTIGPSGGDPQLVPNFLTTGMFPFVYNQNNVTDAGADATSLVEAFQLGIALLTDPAFGCPAGFKKTIIVVSDGVGNCPKRAAGYDCPAEAGNFAAYTDSERQLRGPVTNALALHQISVISLLAGQHSGPHFISYDTGVPNPNIPAGYISPTSESGNFLGPEDLQALGFGGVTAAPDQKLVLEAASVNEVPFQSWCATECTACDNICRENYAWLAADIPGNFFYRPGAVMADIAIGTGGFFCPLLEMNSTHTYVDHDGDSDTPDVLSDANRPINGEILEVPVEELTIAEQAARCITKTWSKRYVLVEEE